MKCVWLKLFEVDCEVLVPVSSILYVLYEYDPDRASPLSPNYNAEKPWWHAVHIFCREGKRFGELFPDKEMAVNRMREIRDSIESACVIH